MTIIPFDCIWKNDHIDVFQTDGKNRYDHGIYNIIADEICEKCGNPVLLQIEGKYNCFESYLHKTLKDIDRTFQLGYYHKKYASEREMKDNDVLSEDILGLKRDPIYAFPLAKSMFMTMKVNFPLLLEADVIVPVPNHQDDFHADAKAVALASELGKQYISDGRQIEVINALRKVTRTSIHGLNRIEREEAVEGMFEYNYNKSMRDKKIVLVDDVLTAGNIKGKCATILKENGAEKVWGFVAGRAI